MGLVTVFWPLMRTGPGETVVQTADETTFVVDCSVNPVALVGKIGITIVEWLCVGPAEEQPHATT